MSNKSLVLCSICYLLIFLVLLLCLPVSITLAETYTCKCKFDTDDYQATGYFAGTCSYTMDETRRKCTLRRAYDYYDIQKPLIKSDLFNDPFMLGKTFHKKAVNMYENPQALTDTDPTDLFSYLMRSSYLAAPFLKDDEKLGIDKHLSSMLKAYGKDILSIFIGLHKKYQEKTFVTESTMYVQKGVLKFTINIGKRKILVCTKVLPKIK